MIKIISYDPAHLDLFEQTEKDIERYGKFHSKMENALADYGITFTAVLDGRILCIGGILQVSVHTGKCWTIVSKHASGHGIKLLKVIKNQLESMMEDMNLFRVETSNLKEATEYHKWCRLLGFKEEGEMPYYDDKKRTHIRFSKIMEL